MSDDEDKLSAVQQNKPTLLTKMISTNKSTKFPSASSSALLLHAVVVLVLLIYNQVRFGSFDLMIVDGIFENRTELALHVFHSRD